MGTWVLYLLATLQAGWMLFDGIHVVRHGKYFGPQVPGPWRHVVEVVGADPFKLGPLFIALGVLWGFAIAAHALQLSVWPLVAMAVLSLWVLPVGTAISVAVLALLYFTRAA